MSAHERVSDESPEPSRPEPGRPEPRWLTAVQVQILHAESIRAFGGLGGVRDTDLLESALGRPRNQFGYGEPTLGEPTLFDLAAAYGYGLARNHAFRDGNKRVALLAIRVFLFLNGYAFVPEEVETVTVMEGVAGGTYGEEILSAWIRDNSAPRSQST